MIPTSDKERAQKVVKRYEEFKREKQPWLNTWQLVGELVMNRQQNFTSTPIQGAPLSTRVFDGSASRNAMKAASAVWGALWPMQGETIEIGPPRHMAPKDRESAPVKEYYRRLTEVVRDVIDHEDAQFYVNHAQAVHELFTFGTSGIFIEEDDDKDNDDDPFKFITLDVKTCCIDEGADGRVNVVYAEREMTIRQYMEKYGEEMPGPSDTVRKQYADGMLEDKIRVLHAIEPRIEAAGGFGNRDMPVASIHIELTGGPHIIKESGYPKMPAFVSRFWKAAGEKYGRSPSTEGMPEIQELNDFREMSILATEKMLDPPLALYDDGALGSDFDTSAGGLVVFNVNGRLPGWTKPFDPLVTIVEMNSTYKRIDTLTAVSSENFMLDRLLDLNNETRMTAYETQVRDEIRGSSLASVYARIINELLTPEINYVVVRLFARKMLGLSEMLGDKLDPQDPYPFLIPDAVAQLIKAGKNAYKIKYVSPAARTMKAEKLRGITTAMSFATELSGIVPDIMDNYDTDRIAREQAELSGMHEMRSIEERDALRAARAQAQQQQQQQQQQMMQAQMAEQLGKGAQAASKAGLPPFAALNGVTASG